MNDDKLAVSAADTELLLAHYAVAGPILERIFGPIPFVWTTMPLGAAGPSVYHGPLAVHTKPKAPVVDVPLHGSVARYPQLSAERILGLTLHGAVETLSWSPTAADPARARFARLLIETRPDAPRALLYNAVQILKALIAEEDRFGGPLLFDGGTGAALFFPFTDAPSYDEVRMWLRERCKTAVERFPETLTLEPNSHPGPCAHLHFASNAIGRFSALPYCARGSAGFPLALPADCDDPSQWEASSGVHASQLKSWLRDEYFSKYADRYASQRFADRKHNAAERKTASWSGVTMPAQKSHGPTINAAIAVLQDGRSHSAEEILQIAIQRGLLDAAFAPKYLYTSLIEYIARAIGNGRKPAIVQNADRSFRINEPPDDWPALEETPIPAPDARIAGLIDQLAATASGAPDAFEKAVCDAFDALGFTTTHLGGQKMPDGYADAPLGPMSYRFVIECKSGDEGVNDPSVFEAAKYMEPYGAKYSALVSRAFSGEIELTKELQNHGVSAWTVDDLQTLLRTGANPLEIEKLFAPGFASDALDDLQWERRHGRAKRVRLIAESLLRTGWTTQSAYRGAPEESPRITEDVAMVLVDQDLAAQGSSATCSREDVRAAIAYLANPLVNDIALDATGESFVVL